MPNRSLPAKSTPSTVMDHSIHPARLTPLGLALLVLHLGVPVLGALVLFDVLVWAAGRYLLDTCIGVWCWF